MFSCLSDFELKLRKETMETIALKWKICFKNYGFTIKNLNNSLMKKKKNEL